MASVSASDTTPRYTLFFEQTPHLDWDWIRTFAQNYWYYTNGTGVDELLKGGINAAHTSTTGYIYSVCEMSFLRRFVQVNPAYVSKIQALGDKFHILGGGIVSPDCLVVSSEAFIRNYLHGQRWAQQTLHVVPEPHCWLPDDFGQGPELPTLLRACGFESVAIARIPGNGPSGGGGPGPAQTYMQQHGLDVMWTAADRSAVLLHWFGAQYNQAEKLVRASDPEKGIRTDQLEVIANFYNPTATTPVRYQAAVLDELYYPLMDDFSTLPTPIPDINELFNAWNTRPADHELPSAASRNVRVSYGSFDSYVKKLLANKDRLTAYEYNGVPYWTGYFASRPRLKVLHQDTVRGLVAAEVIGLLTQPWNAQINSMLRPDFWTRVQQVWTDFEASAHHDFVTGTSPDGVYAGEQLPILEGTAAAARALYKSALMALAGMLSTQDGCLVAANTLGFARSGMVEIPEIEGFTSHFKWSGGQTTRVQRTNDNGMFVYIPQTPSFGYNVGHTPNLDGTTVPSDQVVLKIDGTVVDDLNETYDLMRDATTCTLSNEYLEATISAPDWDIISIKDLQHSQGPAELVPTGHTFNHMVFYDEGTDGDIYQFANEKFPDKQEPWKQDPWKPRTTTVVSAGPTLGASVSELGALCSRVRTEVLYKCQDADNVFCKRFTRVYDLRAGEPFLRMTTTGSAPPRTAVMTTFPLGETIAQLTHGTGYHWTDRQPLHAQPTSDHDPDVWAGVWKLPVFRATHDFVIAEASSKKQLATIYHDAIPAWAVDAAADQPTQNGKVLLGCLFRNTTLQVTWQQIAGGDPAVHTQKYALRVPTGLADAASGQPLREAQAFHTPMHAMRMPRGHPYPGMLSSSSASLATATATGVASASQDADRVPDGSSVSSAPEPMLTIAKPGNYDATGLVLRVYQPSNQAMNIEVAVPHALTESDAKLLTALEGTYQGKMTARVSSRDTSSTIAINDADTITTLQITGLGQAIPT